MKTQVELAAIQPDGSPRPYNQYSAVKILSNDKKKGTVLLQCGHCGEIRCFDSKNLSDSIEFVGSNP